MFDAKVRANLGLQQDVRLGLQLKNGFKPDALASGGWGCSDRCRGGVGWNLHDVGLDWWSSNALDAPGAKSK